MSAYDDAVAYLDAEVHPRCDYDIYSDMRDIVDEMEHENEELREVVRDMFRDFVHADCELMSRHGRTFMAVTRYEPRLRELGIEVGLMGYLVVPHD